MCLNILWHTMRYEYKQTQMRQRISLLHKSQLPTHADFANVADFFPYYFWSTSVVAVDINWRQNFLFLFLLSSVHHQCKNGRLQVATRSATHNWPQRWNPKGPAAFLRTTAVAVSPLHPQIGRWRPGSCCRSRWAARCPELSTLINHYILGNEAHAPHTCRGWQKFTQSTSNIIKQLVTRCVDFVDWRCNSFRTVQFDHKSVHKQEMFSDWTFLCSAQVLQEVPVDSF